MKKIKKYLTFFICLLPIYKLKNYILNFLGHKISYNSKIGFSIILVDKLNLDANTKIGNFNFIKINKVKIFENSIINHFNFLRGNFTIKLQKDSSINNLNVITRGNIFENVYSSYLYLGEKSQISSLSNIDMADSVLISKNSILAGKGIQIWSHGFYHNPHEKRHLIVGKIKIGGNVYIAARVVINPGITIKKNINVGINSAITQNLNEPGLYFSAKNNFIKFIFDKNDYKYFNNKNLEYFKKKR